MEGMVVVGGGATSIDGSSLVVALALPLELFLTAGRES